jgi:HEAT repeat protein
MTSFPPPPALPSTEAALRDAASGSPDSRWVAACALGQVSGERREEAIRALMRLAGDEHEEVRAQALEGLTEQARQGAAIDEGIVLRALADPSPAVQCTAVDSAMVVLSDPYPRIARLKDDGDPSVRIAVASALGEIRSGAADEVLGGLLRDRSAPVRLEAAVALARRGKDSGVDVLIEAASQATAEACDAVRALGVLGTPRAMSVLDQLAGRFFGDPELKAAAKVALFSCSKGQKGGLLIERALGARSAHAKLSMLTAIAELPVKGVADLVGRLLCHRDEMVASSAIHTLVALASVDPEGARAALTTGRSALGPDLALELDECLESL